MAASTGDNVPGAAARPEDTDTERKSARSETESSSRRTSARRPRPEESENSIRPSRARRRRIEPTASVQESTAAERQASAPPQSSSATGTDPWTVPASVRDRFTQEGHRFFFPDGTRAFQDHGRRLSTPSENTQLIRSLVEIAKSRGWNTVVVQGTEQFREEAWRQARLEGLSVQGYRPSDQERAALARAIARRPAVPEEGAHVASGVPLEATEKPQRTDKASGDGSTPAIVGKLLDHGRDTYRFDPHEEMSYFIRIQTPEGKRTFWGKDLERAIKQSLTEPRIGEDVALKGTGQDSVTVRRRERDASGTLLRESNLDTHRNRWVIEKPEFFQAREAAAAVLRDSQIEPKTAVQSHPELAGSYLNLHAAEIAAKALRDPEDQKRFVSLVRAAMADAVERGDALQPVRLREHVHTPRSDRSQREPEVPARS
jgi:Large polyvalent protein-associated domain 7